MRRTRGTTSSICGLAALLVLALAGCDVRQGFDRTGQALDRMLGTDEPAEAGDSPAGRSAEARRRPTSLAPPARRAAAASAEAPAPSPAAEVSHAPPRRPSEAVHRDGLAAQAAGDHARAVGFFRQAAEAGHADAAYELADALTFGRGTERDAEAARHWLELAADAGNGQAQYLVGAGYYEGHGAARDTARGLRYLVPAAERGDARAQYLLGHASANGAGVPYDPAWAARWYGKAAAQGHGPAQFAYGVAWAGGLGLPQNLERAYYWLTLAADHGAVDAADVRDVIGPQLTEADQIRIGREADRFVPDDGKAAIDPPSVLYAQVALRELGHDPGPIDGAAGAATREAVIAFQRASGQPATGEITPDLLRQLYDRRHGVPALTAERAPAAKP